MTCPDETESSVRSAMFVLAAADEITFALTERNWCFSSGHTVALLRSAWIRFSYL